MFLLKKTKEGITILKKEDVRRKTDGFHAFIHALYKAKELDEISEIDDEAFDMLDELDF